MKHMCRHKGIKRKYKHLAAALAGAAILSAALVPGISGSPYINVNGNGNGNGDAANTTAQAPAGQTPATSPLIQPNPDLVSEKSPQPPAAGTASAGPRRQEPSQRQEPAHRPEDVKKVLNITATAYAPGRHDNDQWGNKTYMGTRVRPGVIAVDPRVIPLGSRVFIRYPDGHGAYAVAEDVGGAIKGNRIDVAKSTVREADHFGIKPVKVYVLRHGREEW
ncbi:Hypothetical protein LUCI_5178 [Lucifera butyrica]|uniref:3D domain-containing protein n=1 Tax=Lucifera butyrica TaxID=1351585 RepID=A0A498RGE8_9FIRM|nr:3D domain-containing protein [Lucifera butyrica]VBB09880.1 Hypothetical protein LUCI_5178 [Lucifera butyrica]